MTAPPPAAAGASGRALRLAQFGLLVNAGLAATKLAAGLIGSSYALVADAIESMFDIFGSIVVWSGLRIAARDATDDYPFGYGKAEPLAAAVVALLLLGAGVGIAIEAVREILRPHQSPASWTLAVVVVVILVKEFLARRVAHVAHETGSTAVMADAAHHRSDALTSAAAFVGIALAVLGGPGWESADDWAALVAAAVILVNGVTLLRPALADLMDRDPGGDVREAVRAAALSPPGVLDVEKLKVRRTGTSYHVDIHVQADPAMSLFDAHELSGMVKTAIRRDVPGIAGVLVHMEPFEGEGASRAGGRATRIAEPGSRG